MSYSKEKSFIKRATSFKENVPANYFFQEEAQAWKFPKLLQGHVYTFDYIDRLDEAAIPTAMDWMNPKKLKLYEYQKPYFDSKPIGLSLGRLSEGTEEYLMDLKAMPTSLTLAVLEVFFRAANQIIERYAVNEIKKEDGSYERILRPIEERMRNFDYLKQFVTMNPGYFRQALGNGTFFWVNKYNMNRVKNVKLVDFDVLEKLVHSNYDYDKTIVMNGHTLSDIQALSLHVKNNY